MRRIQHGHSLKHRFDDSCGCAMGALFLGLGLAAASLYYGWQWWAGGLSLSSALARVFLTTFLAASVGKVFGIVRHRLCLKRPSPTEQPSNLTPLPGGH